MTSRILYLLIIIFVLSAACASPRVRKMEVTAYCGCGECCNWERGSWRYLKLDIWNTYISSGPREGQPYSGLTASGTKPHPHHPGLVSKDSLVHPWMIPIRIAFFPWLLLPRDGTVAADTKYHPFGTRLYIPGYGYGVVEDRGGAIKGPNRLDVYYSSHQEALEFGRRHVKVHFLD